MQVRHLSDSAPLSVSIRDVQHRLISRSTTTPRQQPNRPNVNLNEMSYQNKRILIRRQLLLMLHARMCSCEDLIFQREYPNQQRPRCDMPHCGLLKTVLSHMKNCSRGRDCQVTHCSSSRQILSHWKNCANQTCPVCPCRLKPRNYGIVVRGPFQNATNAMPTPAQAPPTGNVHQNGPVFARNLNRFKNILHAEIGLLTTMQTNTEVGEVPIVSSTTGEVVQVEE